MLTKTGDHERNHSACDDNKRYIAAVESGGEDNGEFDDKVSRCSLAHWLASPGTPQDKEKKVNADK